MDFGFGEDLGAEFVGEAGFELDEVFDIAVEMSGGKFDFDGHGVEAVELDEIVATELRGGHENAFDLLGIDVLTFHEVGQV